VTRSAALPCAPVVGRYGSLKSRKYAILREWKLSGKINWLGKRPMHAAASPKLKLPANQAARGAKIVHCEAIATPSATYRFCRAM
jgi:hypothetical protein